MLNNSISDVGQSFQHLIKFVLNGKEIVIHDHEIDPTQPLATYLRSNEIGLKGTKIGCGEGDCGACTVLQTIFNPVFNRVQHRAINSCLMPLFQAHNSIITTIEGVKSPDGDLNPIQQAFVNHHGSQCGYCTPGFIMNTLALLLENPKPTMDEINLHMDGNLCRCTGYRGIIEALREFAQDCQPNDTLISKQFTKAFLPNISSNVDSEPEPACLEYKDHKVFLPLNLSQLVGLKNQYPDSMLIAGNTDLNLLKKVCISTRFVKELFFINIDNEKAIFGAAIPLADIYEYGKFYKEMPDLVEKLSVFGSNQIRSVATIGGTLSSAAASSDLANYLLATDAVITVVDAKTNKKRDISVDTFYKGYHKTCLNQNDIILSITIKKQKQGMYRKVYRQSIRKNVDVSIISATFQVEIDDSNSIKDIRLGFSGMSESPKRSIQAENFLKNKRFTQRNIEEAFAHIDKDFVLNEFTPGGRVEYRKETSHSLLLKFFHQVEKDRNRPFDPSIANETGKPLSMFEVSHCAKHDSKTVGQPFPHAASHIQVTGEAQYCNDIPEPPGTLHAAFVTSQYPHAKILSLDFSNCEGLIDIITADDIKGQNIFNNDPEEVILADKEVVYTGQPIAIVLAKDERTAWKLAQQVQVEYEPLPTVLSVEEAIKTNAIRPNTPKLVSGNVEQALEKCDHVIEGEVKIGGQFHFYMEPNAAIAVPEEDGKIQLSCTCKDLAMVQTEVARILNKPQKDIDVSIWRLGGAFCGKLARSLTEAYAVSLAAEKTKRPVKINMPRELDTKLSSSNQVFIVKYKAGVTNDGIIKAIDGDIYMNGGYSTKHCVGNAVKAMLHLDSAYKLDNVNLRTRVAQTNSLSAGHFRGGDCQDGLVAMESIIQQIAHKLKIEPEEIRKRNMYHENDKTPYGIELTNVTLSKIWDDLEPSYIAKRKEVDEFNKISKYKKRGVALCPIKFGVGSPSDTGRKGSTIVHIYRDGTVIISIGGIEMGQGLYTKMKQIAAHVLEIPIENIRIDKTSTASVANAPGTGGSTGSDYNGFAVLDACNQLKNRLKKYNGTFQDKAKCAFQDKVNLTANGYYANPNPAYNPDTQTGVPYNYYIYGASLSVVEIDLLTGSHQVISSDLSYDCGESLNPAIDIGQVEGGFMQGLGWMTTEEIVFGDESNDKWMKQGELKSSSFVHYKIPNINDVPTQLKVKLTPNHAENPGVMSSRALGEPPCLLAHSVGFAIVDAIKSVRKDWFNLQFPLTCERIKLLSLKH